MRVNSVQSELPVSRNIAATERTRQIKPTSYRSMDSQAEPEISRGLLEDYVEKLNKAVEIVDKRLRFTLHKGSERMQVFVIDNENEEIIKEIPPKELLNIMAKIRETVGLLLDEKI